jgi:hydroxymethylpyrimidine/phosphomethylpyrimidine kinase
MTPLTGTPVILSFCALDPTGGSGITADIETCSSLGCHCAPVITAVTARDTQTIKESWSIDSTILIQQARAILEDMNVSAIKTGMLDSVENIEAVHTILTDYPHLPLIVDPFLQAGSDNQAALVEATRSLLVPLARIMVLNHKQIRLLAPEADSLQASAQVLTGLGCEHIFVSCQPDRSGQISNSLFSSAGKVKSFSWPLLEQSFIGAGSTLSASISACMAHQDSILDAVEQAQNFTWQALKSGRRLGMGDWLPNRIFWSKT